MTEGLSLQEARVLGRKTYFTGLPCRAGHLAERRVNNSTCCECIRVWSLRYAANHREQVRLTTKAWREANPDKVQRYAEQNRERDSATTRAWEKLNPGKVNAKIARRKAYIKRATPSWSDSEIIENIYKEASRISQETGILQHVDHVIPLRSRTVCGLHCPDNLQIIPASENVRKKNIYWPDMPE